MAFRLLLTIWILPLISVDSPLAFQDPSMHWGWTSGYRFIALEGMIG
ncbi:MAG: hypothetical protein IPI90_13940 [Saprospiraceae bacterium]|nr:hypothetical protein [Candidatus Vicinibacter affinis]